MKYKAGNAGKTGICELESICPNISSYDYWCCTQYFGRCWDFTLSLAMLYPSYVFGQICF